MLRVLVLWLACAALGVWGVYRFALPSSPQVERIESPEAEEEQRAAGRSRASSTTTPGQSKEASPAPSPPPEASEGPGAPPPPSSAMSGEGGTPAAREARTRGRNYLPLLAKYTSLNKTALELGIGGKSSPYKSGNLRTRQVHERIRKRAGARVKSHEEALTRALEYEAQEGGSPLRNLEFESVLILTGSSDVACYHGRDFFLPAAPEASLTWLCDRGGLPKPAGALRETALELLRELEQEQHRRRARIVTHAMGLLGTGRGTDTTARLVAHRSGQIVLLRRGEDAELERLCADLARARAKHVEELRR